MLDFPPIARPYFRPPMPRMNRFLVFLAILAMAASAFGQAPAPGGTQGGNLDSIAAKKSQLKTGAQQYFEGGKYDEAIKKMLEYLAMLTPDEKKQDSERVTYLILAESYYRLGKEDNLTQA